MRTGSPNCSEATGRRRNIFGKSISREPTPQFAAEMAEQCDRLLGSLSDDNLRRLAIWKMDGHSNEEIAALMQCTTRTVERKLHLIRTVWSKAASSTRDANGRK